MPSCRDPVRRRRAPLPCPPTSQHRPRSSPFGRADLSLLFLGSLVGALAGTAAGQGPLNPESTISGAPASEAALRIFDAGLLYVAYVESDQVFVRQGPAFGAPAIPLGGGAPDQRSPGIAISTMGIITVIYEEDDPSPSASGPEILYRTSGGSGFGAPTPLSANPLPDEDPSLSAPVGFGARDAAWARTAAGGALEVLFSLDLAPPVVVASGESPDLHTANGSDHELVYLRTGRVRHRSRVGGAWSAETTISGPFTGATRAQVAGDASQAVHATFLATGKCWYVRRPAGGGWSAPIEVTPGVTDVTEAVLAVEPGGAVHVFYLSGGDIWHRVGSSGIFGTNENLIGTPGDPEDQLDAGIDQLGASHLVYRRGGLLRYRNDVPPPIAEFAALPAMGDVPLEVSFEDQSAGVVDEWLWDFGDGAGSNLQDPVHTYTAIGTYTVTLTARGPGGESTSTIPGAVEVTPASNVIRIPEITVLQAQPNVTIPVLATHPEPMQGYQNGIIWDPVFLQLEDATIDGTPVTALTPEFIVINVIPGPIGPTGLTMGVIFDTIPPFDGRVLVPGVDQRILHLVFDIPGSAPAYQSTTIEFVDTIGSPPILNVFIVGGMSRVPLPIHGTVHVIPFVIPPPVAFLRGDFDNNGTIVITDVVQILGYLFSGGTPPACFDAADTNDSGAVEIADAIYLLGFLFVGLNAPPYPWPTPGLDPTADNLGGC